MLRILHQSIDGQIQISQPPQKNVFPCYLHSYQELPTALLPVVFTVIFIGWSFHFYGVITCNWFITGILGRFWHSKVTYNWYFSRRFLAQQSGHLPDLRLRALHLFRHARQRGNGRGAWGHGRNGNFQWGKWWESMELVNWFPCSPKFSD